MVSSVALAAASLTGLAGLSVAHGQEAAAPGAATAPSGPESVTGTVVASQSRWSAGRIVTQSVLRTDDGRSLTVSQMGGTVDGIGMRQFPGQPVLAPGDTAHIEVSPAGRTATGAGDTPRAVVRVVSLTRASSAAPARKGAGGVPERSEFVRTANDNGAPLYWSSGCIFLSYDCDGSSHLPAQSETELLDAVFRTWREATAECSYLDFQLEGSECSEVGFDGKNVIKFRESLWGRPAVGDDPEQRYSPEAAALTTLHFVNDPDSARNGEILDGDIEVNGVNFAVSASGVSDGPQGECQADLANTLTHEVGHLMGLDHTCRASGELQRVDHNGDPVPSCIPEDSLSRDIIDSTMYNFQECGETKKTTPSSDDTAAICAIYAAADDPGECRRASLKRDSGCSASGSPPPAWAAPGVLLLVLVLRRRRMTGR